MHMLHLLGDLAQIFPLEISGKDGTILNIFLACLKTQVTHQLAELLMCTDIGTNRCRHKMPKAT